MKHTISLGPSDATDISLLQTAARQFAAKVDNRKHAELLRGIADHLRMPPHTVELSPLGGFLLQTAALALAVEIDDSLNTERLRGIARELNMKLHAKQQTP